MRWAFAICVAVSASGCDRAFSLDRVDGAPTDADLDRDGISDEVDLCLAPGTDLVGDDDGDGLGNADDRCPLDPAIGGPDDDGDGLDGCDPFPTVPDRSRCLMRFSDVALNTALWRVRPPDRAWSSAPFQLTGDPPASGDQVTTVVDTSIEGVKLTTYDVHLVLSLEHRFGSFTVWLRANPAEKSTDDIGCRYENRSPGGVKFSVVRGDVLFDTRTASNLDGTPLPTRVHARIVTTGELGAPASVYCRLDAAPREPTALTSQASVPLPPGRFGITTESWRLDLVALHIIDQP